MANHVWSRLCVVKLERWHTVLSDVCLDHVQVTVAWLALHLVPGLPLLVHVVES